MKGILETFKDGRQLLSEIVCSDDFEKRLRSEMMDIIPELKTQIGFDQNNPYHHLNLWEHTMEVVRGVPKDDFIGRLGALFHDIAKPVSNKFLPDKGKTVYYNHDADGVPIAYNILNRLGFTNEIIDKVCIIIALHRKIHECNIVTYVRLIEVGVLESFINVVKSDVLAHKSPDMQAIERIETMSREMLRIDFRRKKQEKSLIELVDICTNSPSKLAIFLIGEPRSGKSTLTKELERIGIQAISADRIRQEVFNVKFCPSVEKAVWLTFENKLTESINNENKILIDNTNIKRKSRKEYVHRLKRNGYTVLCINIVTPISTLMLRCDETKFDKNICSRFIVNKEYGEKPEFDSAFDYNGVKNL